ncbi:ParA family protein [Caryophanon latum]|uniref:AAA domain-containing protein n=1 Tax=Caryophanon latum TaxID=33977 RepID=A0A1C0Z1X3_9BACL|nr:ParA family protein [Caryophanon latum]OCS93356.1 hypothetical protein A6K76_05545 [Caryophanon latum]
MAKTITIANFKGGVGKTITTVLFSYLLAEKRDKKVLLVDFDPQGNASDRLFKTYGISYQNVELSIFEAIKNKDLAPAIVTCSENLHVIPAESDLRYFTRLLNAEFAFNYSLYPYLLDALLEPLQDQYDYIFIDVPPTISDYTDNALVATDYLAVVIQTHEEALSSAETFLPYVEELMSDIDSPIKLVAAFPVLMNVDGRTDQFILNEARKVFGNYLTENVIKIRERIKAWGVVGIKDEDMHDKEVLNIYSKLLDEFLEKMEE